MIEVAKTVPKQARTAASGSGWVFDRIPFLQKVVGDSDPAEINKQLALIEQRRPPAPPLATSRQVAAGRPRSVVPGLYRSEAWPVGSMRGTCPGPARS